MSGNIGLAERLLAITALMAESVPPEQTMMRVAQYAADTAPQAAGAVLSELDDGSPSVSVATSPLVRAAHEAQFELGQGPCLEALERRVVVVSDALAADPAWPRYAGVVRRMGLRSALVAPLVIEDSVTGVLGIYASGRAAFTQRDALIAQRYGPPIAAIIRNARVLAQCRAELDQLREALRVRPVVDQAIGILRSRTGESEAEIFERLRAASNAEHIRISDIAARVVDDAVRQTQIQRETG